MAGESSEQASWVVTRLTAGSVVAGYRVESRIGSGGMAMVFRARDESLGRTVALKVLAPALSGDAEFRERFVRESRAVAAVDHPHIIPVYAAGEADGVLYLAMRFITDGDLRSLVAREGPLSGSRAVALLAPIASALDAAHAVGLVHRDIKPANILVDRSSGWSEHPYLSDFGLAKSPAASAGLTGTGQFLGTPDYAAPEQISGKPAQPQTDQYALACVAYSVLTGLVPFPRDEPMAALWAHMHDPPPSLAAARPDLPAGADKVFARALAKVPEERYGTCGEFLRALQSALGPAPRAQSAGFLPPATHAGNSPGNPGNWPGNPVSDTVTSARPAPTVTSRPQPPVFPRSPWDPSPALPLSSAVPVLPKWDRSAPPPAPQAPRPPAGQPRQSLLSWPPNSRTALAGGAAAALLVAAGVFYVIGSPGTGHAGTPTGTHTAPPRAATLAETLTVPGSGTVDTVWISPDGKRIAAARTDVASSIYVWNTASRGGPTKLTVPPMEVGGTAYPVMVENIAFTADDTAMTVVGYPQSSGSASGQSASGQSYVLYQWDLATGSHTTPWSITGTPSNLSFSQDNSTVVESVNGGANRLTLLPRQTDPSPLVIPGGSSMSANSSYDLDLNGKRMLYSPKQGTYSVWDFTEGKTVDSWSSGGLSYLSPDGRSALVFYYSATQTTVYPPPILLDMATKANVTPADSRWQDQLVSSKAADAYVTYSTDGTVITTERAGGKTDLWSASTHKYLLTVTDPSYRDDSSYAVVSPHGSEVVIFGHEIGRSGHEFRRLYIWDTGLGST